MQVLIIEDEKPAAKRLAALLQQCEDSITILDSLDTVKQAVAWFQRQPPPDLTLMDIQLADGLSFDIFEQVTVTSPIIFTTAYDQYAIQAFKVNSVDYLLKPIGKEDLQASLHKFASLHAVPKAEAVSQNLTQIRQAIHMLTQPYKNRFVVKVGEHIKAIPVEEVLYCYSLQKATYIQTTAARKYVIDYTLDHLETLLPPHRFFRINRQYIISLEAFEDIITYSSSRLKIKLLHSSDTDVLVSRDRVVDFKQWLDQ